MLQRSMNVKYSDELSLSLSEKITLELLMEVRREGNHLPFVVTLCNDLERGVVDRNISLFRDAISRFPSYDAGELEAFLTFQAQALFKKSNALDFGVDREKAALDLFVRSERLCLITNKILNDPARDPLIGARAALIHEMQRKISDVLGPCPDIGDVIGRFGPGSNVGCSKYTSVRFKLSADATATLALSDLIDQKGITFHAWPMLNQRRTVRGSRWTSVPKTWATDRGINVEPLVNSFFQASYGEVIRNRLKRVGVDLRDQTLNQRLALRGSKAGDLATIDLSMASDLISYNLVRDLLPFEWFDTLDVLRSPEVEMPDGSFKELQKFSAMGNGFTFELESLIFWAMLKVISADRVFSVYGDDLICESDVYDAVINAVSLLGFVPNANKSFGSGPFRESCGKDYWDGTDVRPLFIKQRLEYSDLFRIHNFALRTGRLAAWKKVALRHIPVHVRLFGPDGFGDGHLLWSNLPKPLTDRRGYSPYYLFKTYAARTRSVKRLVGTEYFHFLYLYTYRGLEAELPYESIMLSERSRANERKRYSVRNIRVPAELCTLCNLSD